MRGKIRVAVILAAAAFLVCVCAGTSIAKQDEIWDMLKDDHSQVKKIIGQLKDTQDMNRLGQLQQMLAAHMQFEEKNIYPVLAQNQKTAAMALQAQNEHKLAKEVLNNLVKNRDDRTQWAANINQLDQLISNHVKFEQSRVFDEGKKLISKDQSRQLGAQYAEMKSMHPKAKVQPESGQMQQQPAR